MRTFIAIEVSDEVKKAVAEFTSELKKERSHISWVRQGNVHITLKFLGEIDEEKIPEIQKVLTDCVRNQKKFGIEVKGCGGFPNLRRPRIIWVGITGGAEELESLTGTVDNGLSLIGFEKENRGFKPHLTIGRVKSIYDTEAFIRKMENTEFSGGRFTAGEIVLMKSDLKPAGAEYTKLWAVKFQD